MVFRSLLIWVLIYGGFGSSLFEDLEDVPWVSQTQLQTQPQTQQPPNNTEGSGESDDEELEEQGDLVWNNLRLTTLVQNTEVVPTALDVLDKLYAENDPVTKALTGLFLGQSLKHQLLSKVASETVGNLWIPYGTDVVDRELGAVNVEEHSVNFIEYVRTLSQIPSYSGSTPGGFQHQELIWERDDDKRRSLSSAIDVCELNIGSCFYGNTASRMIAGFIAELE